MDWDNFVLNCCAFIAGLFLLQHGANIFIDHSVILAKRVGAPDSLISLLTVGAEWEELAIVIASIVQHQPSLGLANIVGSCIANVLGAFAFGLLVQDFLPRFDSNSRIYAGALLVVSSIFLYLSLTGHLDLTGGIFFLVSFSVYIVAICGAIYDRILATPTPETRRSLVMPELEPPRSEDVLEEFHRELHISIYPSVMQCHPDETTPLVKQPPSPSIISGDPSDDIPPRRRVFYHAFKIIVGLSALSIAAYLLAHGSGALATALNLSPTTFGITIMSFFTTLPEKIPIAVATWRGHHRVMVTSTAGANIFLLTLCVGLILVTGNGNEELAKSITTFEVWTVWCCALVLMLIMFVRGRKWMGGIMLGFYLAFLAAECTVNKK
ncbi:uncharacterized protein PAC_11757 [Phialocephala subalpina]|uniref:Sodium/calcium exchanger membrane region domain-containing protein n=1 Tax=Phialocephala subalpina TaxID=576137 RepID=A0A1L7XA06_9HELO|nr:uncharacterized protein PAC_11757 [Phialocephala subalpina]